MPAAFIPSCEEEIKVQTIKKRTLKEISKD